MVQYHSNHPSEKGKMGSSPCENTQINHLQRIAYKNNDRSTDIENEQGKNYTL